MECTSVTSCPHSKIKFSTFDHNQENQGMIRAPVTPSKFCLNFKHLWKASNVSENETVFQNCFNLISIFLPPKAPPSGFPNIQNCSQGRLSELSHRKAKTRFACKTSRALQYLFLCSGKIQIALLGENPNHP